jgi:Capsular polysaccharide synthesis protein
MLNKTIWLLWLQGWDNAPWLIKQVAESWEINNPDWNIEYVTLDNLHEYVCDIDYIYDEAKKIEPQHKADIIRLSLLKNHGGVWADATMLCMQPLDTWIEEAVHPSGLWMYHGHGAGMSCKDGPAIWLIVSEKGSVMIDKWKNACDEYWGDRTHADGYFLLDELFRKLHESDSRFRDKWELTPYLYCESKGQAHSLSYNQLILNSQGKKRIFMESPPYALKLSWKVWQDRFPDLSNSEYKDSNGYYAIQMSKRKFIFKHKMVTKGSIIWRARVLALDILFDLKMFKMFRMASWKRKIQKISLVLLSKMSRSAA